MVAKERIKIDLPSLDDLFSTQEERDQKAREQVLTIELSEITDFPEHPFKVREDEEMTEMIESVKQYGVLVPALVRPREDGGYEMVSGHRRKFAAEQAGLEAIPCISRNLSDDEAIIIMVDANLQREHILPSERAFAYSMKLEAMKRQGERTDLTSTPVVSKLRSDEMLGKEFGESREQIRRYIRLTNLIPDILEMVDDKRMAFRPAVELSYLTVEEQSMLFDNMTLEDRTPSLSQAIKMKEASRKGELSEEAIFEVLSQEKPNQKEKVKISKNRLEKYFPKGTSNKEMEDTIVNALEMYLKRTRDKVR